MRAVYAMKLPSPTPTRKTSDTFSTLRTLTHTSSHLIRLLPRHVWSWINGWELGRHTTWLTDINRVSSPSELLV